MNKFLNVMRAVVLTMALGSLLQAQASVADAKIFQIPGPKADGIAGAAVPYVRYDSQKASLGGGATLKTSAMMDRFNIASQASEHSYVELPGNGASAEWTVHVIKDANVVGRGVTMRFTMPDTGDGMGQKGSLDVYVNGNKVKTVDLNSYWMWQYFASGNPSDAPDGGVGCFAFDEVHFLLDEPLKEGDRIKIQSSGANGLTYGVDFLEIEDVVNPIGRPSGAVSVTDFGACPDDGKDDLAAFVAAVKAADAGSKVVYIPKGTWHLSGMWNIYCKDVKITGAGIWYTNIQFTSDKAFGGGISGGNGSNGGADGYCKNLEFCHMYINSNLRSRYNQMAVYKCFMDVFCDGSVIHDVWEEHFETGFWFGDYNGAMDYSDGVKVINCRIRNNLADGVNFCQGTSNAAVYNCSIRNNGDDGLACWNNSYMNAKDEENNVFAYNTIEFIWRAGGIALYGGSGHHVYNNYIRDMFMAAGIHLNTTFDGYKFSNNKGITFENNILVRCGTNADSWNEDLAAIDLKQDVKNITFRNTQIYDSPFDAVRTLTGPSNVVFYDTQILGTGLTGEDITYSCVGHTCGAMRIADKNVKFDGLKIANYGSDKKGNNSTYPFWTDNNKDLAQSLGAELLGNNVSYVVPEAGRVIGLDPVVDPWENVKDYDLELKELSWRNQNDEYNLQEGDQVVLYGKIKNNSDVDIPEKANFTVVVNIDGVSKGSVTISDGLKAHESVDFKLASSWESVKGGHVAVATVCPDTDLKNELTEDNNSRTKRFNVSASADNSNKFTPVTGGYDLVVTKVFVSNKKDEDAINTGDHLVMGAVIANAGDKDIPAGTKIGLQFQMDGKTYGTGFITWCDTFKDGLKSHATATLIANGGGGSVTTGGADNYFIAPEGSHTITAWIDDTNEWKEVDENNNKKDMTLMIPFGGVKYLADTDLPDDVSGENPPVPVVKSTIVNGIKYEIVNDYAQVAGWDELTFPANGIAVIEKNVKIGDNYYDVKRIAGGYDDKLSGSKCDEAGAFYSCSQIKGIVLPDGIEVIGDHAFKNASIEYFNLPGSLSTIGAWAFENTQLTNVTLPWTISNVGEGAFYNIPTLTTVVWTANVWSFPNMVFNSPNVKDVYFTLPYSISEKGDWTWNNNALPRFHTRPAGIESWKSAGYENIDDQVIIKPEENLVPCSFNFDVDFTDVSGISAYKGAYDEGKGAVVLTKVNKIGAQNGFLVRVNDVPVGGYSKEYAARILDNGDDCDSFEGNSIWASTTPTYITDENQYYFANGCFNRLSEPRFVPGMSAWLNLYDKAGAAKDALGFDFLAPPSSTGIHSVQVDNNESAAYYILSGMKIAKPTTKGVYIYKGKKVVF